MRKKYMLGNALIAAPLILFSIFCIFPMLIMVINSFAAINDSGKFSYSIIPEKFTLDAYKIVFESPERIIKSYMSSTIVTVLGVFINLTITAMIAFPLSRPDYKYRNSVTFYLFFTMLFSGGLVPTYIIMTRYLFLKDTYAILILMSAAAPFNVFLLKTFMREVPNEIIESARMDGCGIFRMFYKIVLPVSKPGLATVGLMLTLGYWNDWFTPMIYMDKSGIEPLPLMLTRVINYVETAKNSAAMGGMTVAADIPSQAVILATCLVAIGPMLFVFMFFQKYFVRGLTLGSVKG